MDGITEMTIPTVPVFAPIPEYTPSWRAVPQVQPFTYRDGETMLNKLTGLCKYMNKNIVPFINDGLAGFSEDIQADMNALIDQVNAAIEAISSDSIDVQDPVVAAIFNNAASATRIVTDALYGSKSDVTTLNNLVATGRLSVSALDSTYVNETTFAAWDAARVDTVAQGGTGRATGTTANGIVLTGSTPTGAQQTLNEGASGTYLKSVGAATLPVWDKPVDDTAASTDTVKGWSAKKISDSIAAAFAPNLYGTFASRPAANTVPNGTIFAASDVPEQYMANAGSWVVVGSGGNQLAYAQVAAVLTNTTTALQNIPGFTVTFIAGARPVKLNLYAKLKCDLASNIVSVRVKLDGVIISEIASQNPGANQTLSYFASGKCPALTPGSSHTITVDWIQGLAATATMDGTGNSVPAWVEAVTL